MASATCFIEHTGDHGNRPPSAGRLYGTISTLPKVALRVIQEIHMQPKATIFTRVTDNALPYCVVELNIICCTYAFIVPFTNKYTIDYSEEQFFQTSGTLLSTINGKKIGT